MAKPGRKRQYTDKIADTICDRLAKGETLRAICRDEGYPSDNTVRYWLLRREGFAVQYATARNFGLDSMAEELVEIADEKGGEVARDRLRVDTRKWYLSKLAPKRYGERVNVDLGVQDSLAEVMKEIDGRSKGLHGKGD